MKYRYEDLVRMLSGQAAERGDRTAFTFLEDGERPAGSITFAELDRRARAVAATLQDSTAPGDRALLLFDAGLDFIAAFFGCLYAEVVAVTAFPPSRARIERSLPRLGAIVESSRPTAVLATEHITSYARDLADDPLGLRHRPWVDVDTVPNGAAAGWAEPGADPERVAFLQYTSGSTSVPKGVVVTHGNLLANLEAMRRAFGLQPDEVSVTWLPSFHDMGLIDGLLESIYSGDTTCFMSPASFVQKPIRWLDAISRFGATHSGAPNFAYDLCVDRVSPEQRAELDLSTWRNAYNGAEPVREETLHRFTEYFAPCGFRASYHFPCYGLAEGTLMVSGTVERKGAVTREISAAGLAEGRIAPPEGADDTSRLVSSGRPVFNADVAIVDPESLRRCPEDRIGEIWVRGDIVARGYWERPEETEETFGARIAGSDGEPWMRTGDLGFLHDGELFISSRLKDLIILRGRNVYPQDVELSVERSHPRLRPNFGVAFSVEADGEERLVIVYEVHRQCPEEEHDEVMAAVRRAVAEEHEAEVEAVTLIRHASLQKTSSGKLQRRGTRAAWLAGELQVVAEWRRDRAEEEDAGPASPADVLRRRAGDDAEATAFVRLDDAGEVSALLSYGELHRRAGAIAAWLARHGGPGDRVLLIFPQGFEFLEVLYGCFYAGRVAVPAPPVDERRGRRTLPRLRSMIRDSEPSFLFTTPEAVAVLAGVVNEAPELAGVRWLTLEDVLGDGDAAPPEHRIHRDDLAVLQYTSGSTAAPKGVMITHGNLLRGSEFLTEGFQYSADSRSLMWVPNFHDDGLVQGAVHPVCQGFPCYLMSPLAIVQRPARWLRAISRYRITHSGGPNFVYALCLRKVRPEDHPDLDLSSWVTAYNPAEAVRRETLEAFHERFHGHGLRWETLCPAFGLAETTLVVASRRDRGQALRLRAVDSELLERTGRVATVARDAEGARQYVGCGRALLDARIEIVDPATALPLEPDRVGEVWIAASCVAAGYWRNRDQTAATFRGRLAGEEDGPLFLRTGDLGFLDADGELYLAGRIKDLIVIRGRNIHPQDLEVTVERSHPALRPGCGVAFSVDEDGEERLVLVQEVRHDREEQGLDEAIRAVRAAVAREHEVEAEAVVLLRHGTLKTSSGKLQRRGTRAAFLNGELDAVAEHRLSGPAPAPESARPRAAGGDLPVTRPAITRWLVGRLAERARVEAASIDPEASFASHGLDSRVMVELSGLLAEELGRDLPATLLYDFPTPREVAEHLTEQLAERPAEPRPAAAADEPVAVVGIGCRMPGAADPAAFWELLRQGRDAITEVPADRWDAAGLYTPEAGVPGRMNTRWGGFLDGVDRFDAGHFGLTPREADLTDPQQRLLLEVAWETLEDAAVAPESFDGAPVGVFVGVSGYDYGRLLWRQGRAVEGHAGAGAALSIAANRLSYFFGFRGPSLAVDTACSSSLVAIHLAMRSLRQGECRAALAGGVNLVLSPEPTIGFSQAGMMSSDGRCRTFADGADGYVRSEGCGLVLLKTLSAARADGDPILAVLRGSAINQDGRSNGLTAPNGPSQQAVIRAALADAGLTPEHLQYVEAHGTGTTLGDPIELQALAAVLGERPEGGECRVGSVKTNIGHLESAAGIAGLLKVILALRHGEIPPHLHLETPNAHLRLSELPVTVPTAGEPWPAGDAPRVAGVSSFGFGGTNAHVVVEEAPRPAESAEPAPEAGDGTPHLLPISARTPEALRTLAGRWADALEAGDDTPLADLCHAAATGRARFDHRLAAVAESRPDLAGALRKAAAGDKAPWVTVGSALRERPRIAFVFTGQGAQHHGMARELYDGEPVFRAHLDRCDALWRPASGPGLLEVVYGEAGESGLLDETAYTQPALFAVETALAALWRSWGIEPDAVLGHSIGEIAAACVAGAVGLEDGLRLAGERGRLIQELSPPGAMAAVAGGPEAVAEAVERAGGAIEVAAVNGPRAVTLAGEPEAIEAAVSALAQSGLRVRRLPVTRAFHSRLMDPVLPPFAEVLAGVAWSDPAIPLVTCAEEEPEGLGAEHWLRHLREPVRFLAGVRRLLERGCDALVEVGPKPALSALGREIDPEAAWLPSLRPPRGDRRQMLSSLGALWTRGAEADWRAVGGRRDGAPRRRVALPLYPFERRRHWLEDSPAPAAPPREAWADWLYDLAWEPRVRLDAASTEDGAEAAGEGWLLLDDEGGAAEALAGALAARGERVERVAPDGFDAALGGLAGPEATGYRVIVDLRSLGLPAPEEAGADGLGAAQDRLCGGLARLVRALARPDGEAGSEGAAPRLWIVTRGAQPVEPGPVAVGQAPIWGLAQVASLEHPELAVRRVDLDPDGSAEEETEALAAELLAPSAEDRIALRRGRRFVARLVRRAVPKAEPLTPRGDATYLVTGGLGGLGLAVARRLVERGARHLVLTSRRGLTEDADPATREAVAALERLGATVATPAVDAADAEGMARALSGLSHPLRGVVHAAGVARPEPMASIDEESLRASRRPKVEGAWILHELTRDEPLDFFVLFGSISGVWGSTGLSKEAAGNHFLDALAHHRRALGLPAHSIDWGPWAEVGMAARDGRDARAGLRRMGVLPMRPEVAVDVLVAVANAPVAQTVVADVDWPRFRAVFEARRARPLLERMAAAPTAAAEAPAEVAPGGGTELLERLAAVPVTGRPEVLREHLRSELAALVGLAGPDEVDPRKGFFDLGMDSIMAVELRGRLEVALGRRLPPGAVFDHPDVERLAGWLLDGVIGDPDGAARSAASRPAGGDAVAVVGLGCRFPGAAGPERFWELLRTGTDAVGEVPADRWDVDAYYHPDPERPGTMYTRWGGFVDGVDRFDAEHFGISNREAAALDPQQRMLLEVSWEALEHAGVAPSDLAGARGGVFVGITSNEYLHLQLRAGEAPVENPYFASGGSLNVAAGRLAYTLGLHGPALAVDTACSSSLVAIHLACRSLRSGESDVALAAGVNLTLMPEITAGLCRARMLSPTGRCRTLDEGADGYVRGEGCGVVVLKRLDDALADGDSVLAVVRGSASNQDGRSSGLTAPNGTAQQEVVRAALDDARVAPERVGYVEMHGTGTPLGDPIEVDSLNRVLGGPLAERGRRAALGAVKTNIGHLESAAGVAGLIKAVLCLHHGELVPNLHLRRLNPQLDLGAAFFAPGGSVPWPVEDGPRVAGVSAFGFSGTNAHVVLEEAPAAAAVDAVSGGRPEHLLALSARTPGALAEVARRYERWLADHPGTRVLDLCATANAGRSPLAHRAALRCRDAGELRRGLAALAAGDLPEGAAAGEVRPGARPRVAFLFADRAPGGMAEIAAAGRELHDLQPAFRAAFDRCAELFRPYLDRPLRAALENAGTGGEAGDSLFDRAALFALEHALAETWRAWGVVPDAVLGHGLGEITAATAAGALDLPDAVALVAADDPEAAASALSPRAPRLRWVSSVTGLSFGPSEVPDAAHWRRPAREPERFEDGARTLAGEGVDAVVGIGTGAHPLLATPLAVPSLHPGRGVHASLLDGLARLWVRGAEVRWRAVDGPFRPRRLALPTYPFERRRHWFKAADRGVEMHTSPSLPTPSPGRGDTRTRLRSILAELLEIEPETLDVDLPFLEMGADSLVLMDALRRVEGELGVTITMRQIFEELPTFEALADHVERHGRVVVPAPAQPLAAPPLAGLPSLPAAGAEGLPELFAQQLQAVEQVVRRQLEILGVAHPASGRAPAPAAPPAAPAARATAASSAPSEAVQVFPRIDPGTPGAGGFDPGQRRHLDAMIERHDRRHARTKETTQRYRPVLADNRASAGFRFSIKEMLYPIIAERSDGARIWDVDGNEYVDIAMGFGVNLFGYNPPFVTEAIREQLARGVHLGPQSDLAGEVAELLCETTGMERATFCNSGTEAVMTAIRVARAATGRSRVAVFSGSYHGHFDGTLARALADGRAEPMVPGVRPGFVEDVLMLDYGAPESLELLRRYADDLAAVVVEPVQSRRPDLQPVEYLHDLRALTRETGSLLVFDEIITGFRSHPGGAQARFGVEADLATYGKVLGGGLPIGAVAGRHGLLDAIDGGVWRYGDESYPGATTTFFAGTFCKHPLAMASARAVLRHLRSEGPALQRRLDERTAAMADELDAWFESEEIPIRISRFSSLFRFAFKANQDLLFYHLLERGIHTWEGRTCFLSTAHTDEDVARIVEATRESALAMREGGFLPRPDGGSSGGGPAPGGGGEPFPLTDRQQEIWTLSRLHGEAGAAHHSTAVLRLLGALDPEVLERSLRSLALRHEALRTVFDERGERQRVLSEPSFELRVEEPGAEAEGGRSPAERWLERTANQPFGPGEPLWRARLLRAGEWEHLLVITLHQAVADGWSLGVLLQELGTVYSAEVAGRRADLPAAMPFRDYAAWREATLASPRGEAARAYWRERLVGPLPRLAAPTDRPRPAIASLAGGIEHLRLGKSFHEQLTAWSARSGGTLFMTLLAAFQLFLHRLTGTEDLVVLVPTEGQSAMGESRLVGDCVNLLPIRGGVDGDRTVAELLAAVRGTVLDAMEHQSFSFPRLLRELEPSPDPAGWPLFNLDRAVRLPELGDVAVDLLPNPVDDSGFELDLNALPVDGDLLLSLKYRTDLFAAGTVERWLHLYGEILRTLVALPADAPLRDVLAPAEEEWQRVLEPLLPGDAGAPSAASSAGPTEPPSEEQEPLARIWREVLRTDAVSPGDDFFARGGHSLLAARLALAVREELGVELTLRDLFEAPTLAAMAARIAAPGKASTAPPPISRLAPTAEPPLSFAQERHWFLHEMEPDTPLYNSGGVVRLRGAFDLQAFVAAFHEILRRHDVLRATFSTEGGRLVQRLAESLAPGVPVVDLERVPAGERERRLDALLDAEVKRLFDLGRGPLVRSTVFRLGPEDHAATLTFHHIVSDGWSIGLLSREILALYRSFAEGRPPELREPPLQYADFAAWQREWLQGEALEKHLDFWCRELAGATPVTFPEDRPRGEAVTSRGGRHTVELPGDLVDGLRELAAERGVTLFMMLLAGFLTVLHRFTRQDDLVIGAPVANRLAPGTEEVVGCFIHVIAVRAELSGDQRFVELLDRVRDAVTRAFAYQGVPFEKVVEALAPERVPGRSPVFDVVFNLETDDSEPSAVPGLSTELVELDRGMPIKHDVTVYARDDGDGLSMTFAYRLDLYEETTIVRIAEAYTAVLRAVVTEPEIRLSRLGQSMEGERRHRMPNPKAQDDNHLKRLLGTRRRAVPSRTSLVETGRLEGGGPLPMLVTPATDGVDLHDWIAGHRESVEKNLLEHGGILFRGFDVPTSDAFHHVTEAMTKGLVNYVEGSSERIKVSDKVYTSTEYPPELFVSLHNELSYAHRWPKLIFFYCLVEPQIGGETPICDSRKVLDAMPDDLKQKFFEKGVTYMRNLHGGRGAGLSWQSVFETDDRDFVERYCREGNIEFEWKADGGLRTRQVRPAIVRHPVTGELIWFNQADQFHPSNLGDETARSLAAISSEEELPLYSTYGDGTPFEPGTLEAVRRAFDETMVAFPWRHGDVLILDNMLVAHGRKPFEGPRRIVVSMGDPVGLEEMPPVGSLDEPARVASEA